MLKRKHRQQPPQPLRIEGIDEAPHTPEPDEAELAAQAVLEMMCDVRCKREDVSHPSSISHQPSDIHDAAYYEQLAQKIRHARESARQRTVRFLDYCERTLQLPVLPETGPNSLALIEAELYKRIDIIEREGGELKRRWQHCLADVTVRLMKMNDV
jgi:hypothetical protein